MSSHTEIFDRIYRDNVWGQGSGTGSREGHTRAWRAWLHSFLRSNRIASVVDLGCGDLPGAGLLIAKDVLQHWSNDDIPAFLPSLKKYRAALIVNGFPDSPMGRLNENIATGAYHRAVDLSQPPIDLPGWFVFGFETEEPKFVHLWTHD
jgi:hypothetical protein